MSKRTNELYRVTMVRYAYIAVEAHNPDEAMKIAGEQAVNNLDDNDYWDSGDNVESCDTYPVDIEQFNRIDDHTRIFTVDGELSFDEYYDQLEAQEEENPLD